MDLPVRLTPANLVEEVSQDMTSLYPITWPSLKIILHLHLYGALEEVFMTGCFSILELCILSFLLTFLFSLVNLSSISKPFLFQLCWEFWLVCPRCAEEESTAHKYTRLWVCIWFLCWSQDGIFRLLEGQNIGKSSESRLIVYCRTWGIYN